MNRLSTVLASAALLAASAGAAHAQFVVERQADAPAKTRASTPTVQSITSIKDGARLKIRIEDGQVAYARVNGADWPADRIEHTPRRIVLLASDGSEAHAFNLTPPGAPPAPPAASRGGASTAPQPPATPRLVVRSPDGTWTTGIAPSLPAAPPAAPPAPEPPPVMIGFSFSEPGEALRSHLGLGDARVIMVERVMEGTPAEKAGMKKHDIIVSIAGSDGASDAVLLERLRQAKPGEQIELKIRRGAETIVIRPELTEYRAQRLTPSVPIARAQPGPNDIEIELEFDDEDFRDAARSAGVAAAAAEAGRRMIAQLEAQLAAQAESLEGEIDEEFIERLHAMHEHTLRRFDELASRAERQVLELRDGRLFVRPAQEAQGAARGMAEATRERSAEIQDRVEARLRSLEERLQSLEERLESRVERLGSLLDRLESRLERDAAEDRKNP